MKENLFIFVVTLLQSTSILCADEGYHELKASVQSIIQVFHNHDQDFVENLKPLVPKIFEVPKAELDVSLGLMNVSVEVAESFVKLQDELSTYSKTFSKIMKEIDAESHPIKLQRCVDAIQAVMSKRKKMLEANDDNEDLVEEFKAAFQKELILISDVLFDNLYNKFDSKKGLFQMFAARSHEHPVETAEFVHGCLQILTQLTVLETNYVDLMIDTEDAVTAFRGRAEKRWEKVLHVAMQVIKRQKSIDMVFKQIKADQRRFHKVWKSLSNCEFARQTQSYFNSKYPKYNFLVISYSPVTGFNDHTITGCVPGIFYLFRLEERNSIVLLIPNHFGGAGFSNWARNMLDRVPMEIRAKKSHVAETVSKEIEKQVGKCRFAFTLVLTMRAAVCAAGSHEFYLESMKTAKVCKTLFCWSKHRYPQRVFVAGRNTRST